MNHDTKTSFLVFLFIFGALILSQRTHAAISLAPVVPGYGAGLLSSAAGTHTMTAANDGYLKPSIVNVGGKAVTVPARLRMAANAGTLAKSAMRLYPALLVGTLAAGWLYDHYMQPDGQGGFEVITPGVWWAVPGYANPMYDGTAAATQACTQDSGTLITYTPLPSGSYGGENVLCQGGAAWNNAQFGRVVYKYQGTPGTRPAEQADWDALPDPLSVVGPELPYAPYMVGGAPVDAPEYDFTPFSVPIGQPYEKMDGSTAQPMAKVSPNEDMVTVDTYDQPLTDPQGNPVLNPVPEDTLEPTPESKTDCEKFPSSIGCMELGTVTDPTLGSENRSIASITPVSVGGAGSCPAPLTASFMGHPVSFSYDMPCSFATSLKPLILVIAWLSAGLIFIGGVRQ